MIAVRTWARGVRGVPAEREHVSAVPRPARQHPLPHLGEDAGEAPLRVQVHGPGLPGRVIFHCTTFVEKWTTLITRNSNLGEAWQENCNANSVIKQCNPISIGSFPIPLFLENMHKTSQKTSDKSKSFLVNCVTLFDGLWIMFFGSVELCPSVALCYVNDQELISKVSINYQL